MSLTQLERKAFNSMCKPGAIQREFGFVLRQVARYIDWLEREQEALIAKNNELIRPEYQNPPAGLP